MVIQNKCVPDGTLWNGPIDFLVLSLRRLLEVHVFFKRNSVQGLVPKAPYSWTCNDQILEIIAL